MRPFATLLLPFLLLAAAPVASAAPEASCEDPQGDVEAGFESIDILRVSSREVDGVMQVRATFAEDPAAVGPSFSFSVDFEGDDEADLSFRDDGTGIFRNVAVYWDGYPMAAGNDIVWRLSGKEVDEAAMVGASKWNVAVGAHSLRGADPVTDLATCEAGGKLLPGHGPALALAVMAGVAWAARRRW